MSRLIHYQLDQGGETVVCICSLCDWRALGLDRDEAQSLIRQHLIRAHPGSKASFSAAVQHRRAR